MLAPQKHLTKLVVNNYARHPVSIKKMLTAQEQLAQGDMMKKRSVGVRIGMITLGILDIGTGLFLMPFLFLFGVVTFMVGLLYFIFGVAVLFGKVYLKVLFYGIIPFTILHAVVITMLSIDQDVSNYFRMSLVNRMGWILPFLFTCLLNIYFFTRPRVKEQFE